MKFNSAFTTTLSAVAVGTAMGFSASPALSADFTISGSSGTWSNVVGGADIKLNVPVGDENQIRWGVGAGEQSGLAFTGVGVTEFDAGEIFKIGTLRHLNNGVGEAATATDLGITLDFLEPGGLSKTFAFTFGINETNNAGPLCPVGVPPCADIISFPSVFPSETFEFMGKTFTLELVKFANSVNEPGTNQFISPEGGTNSTMLFGKVTGAKVTGVDVPEPGSILGLLFLGGLSASSLRSRAAKARLK
ncbi:MAG: THxN family PEP-CTERM protein [Cyanobacteriota bacterium]|nr:THxN family PEP-CTERM protein [Cyanobacteriota bacterium]